jgi:hypothetical protein
MVESNPVPKKWNWKPIVGIPGYYVDSEGRVWVVKRGERSKPKEKKTPSGYLWLNLFKCSNHILRYIHRIVLEAFMGPHA